MQAIEFSGVIKEGKIEVPKQYHSFEQQHARVIVLLESPLVSQKERLAAIFKRMESVEMFSEINNPVAWQKQLRDEWE